MRPIVSENMHEVSAFYGSICGLKGAVETSTNGASCIHYCGTQATRLSLFSLPANGVMNNKENKSGILARYRKHIGFENSQQVKNDLRKDTSRLVTWVIFIGGLWLLWLGIALVIVPALTWFIEGVPFEVSLDNLFQ